MLLSRHFAAPPPPRTLYAGLLLFTLILLLAPHAGRAQSFSNVQGNVYRTTGSGSNTGFGTLIGTLSSTLDPTQPGGDDFNTNATNFGLPPGSPFAIRWTGNFTAPYNGTYTFTVTSDDGFRFYLTNGTTQVGYFQNWTDTPSTTQTFQVALTAGASYTFKLEYYENGVGNGTISLGATTSASPPSTSLSLRGSQAINGVSLRWNNDPKAAHYKVFWGTSAYNFSTDVQAPATSYNDTSGTPGQAYYYIVYAYDSAGNVGPGSNSVQVVYPTPSVPSGLTANTVSNGIALSWSALATASSWYIYRRASTETDYRFYASIGQNTTSYLDTGYSQAFGGMPATSTAVSGTTYYYYVAAVDANYNTSSPSNTVNAIFPYAYTGWLDYAGPSGISGWAEDTRLPNQALTVDLYDGTTLIQSAISAANYRGDSGIGYHGFSIATPTRLLDGQTHTVSVKYGGTSINLNDSPKTINPPAAASFTGWLDYAGVYGLSGWAQDTSRASTSVAVDLYDGTTFVQTIAANVARGDIQPGNHGFSLGMPARFLDGATHILHVRHSGTSRELYDSPKTINPSAASGLYGWLDQADKNALSGWTQDSTQPSTSLSVDLYDGVTYFQTVSANIARGDIQPGNHGFTVATPARLMDGKPHVLHARYGGTATELHGSPVTLTIVPSLNVPNFSFEIPALSGTSFVYSPTGASWTFNAAGIATNKGVFTGNNPNAPDGVQVAFVQGQGTISQSIPGFVANTSYAVTVAAAQRGNGNSSSQTVQVSLDSVVVGAFTPTSTSYADYTVNYTAPTSGSHTLTFTGTNPNGGDNSALIDNVRIVKVVNPDFSVSTDTYSDSLSLTDGASYDGGPSEVLITATPYNGFTGDVTFRLSYLDAAGSSHSGAPGGMYYWFGPATDADEGVGLVTISDPSSQDALLSICPNDGNPTPGTYTLIVTATSGSITHTTSMTLTITN